MFLRGSNVAAVLMLFLTGCTIHPLPEDQSGYSSYDIAQRIRCEARLALTKKFIDILRASGTPKGIDLASDLAKGKRDVGDITPRDIPSDVVKIVQPFYRVQMAFGFEFDIAERNINSSNLKLELPFTTGLTSGTFSLATSGGIEKRRQNNRQFTLVDGVRDLIKDKEICSNPRHRALGKNRLYPITGEIGLAELIDTFYRLEPNISRKTEKDKSRVYNFSETLTFITEISGAIEPKVVLKPVSDSFRLTQATAETSATRIDKHKLNLAIILPDKRGKVAGKPASAVLNENIEVLKTREALRGSGLAR